MWDPPLGSISNTGDPLADRLGRARGAGTYFRQLQSRGRWGGAPAECMHFEDLVLGKAFLDSSFWMISLLNDRN